MLVSLIRPSSPHSSAPHLIAVYAVVYPFTVTGEELHALAAVNDVVRDRYAQSQEHLGAVEQFSELLVASRE